MPWQGARRDDREQEAGAGCLRALGCQELSEKQGGHPNISHHLLQKNHLPWCKECGCSPQGWGWGGWAVGLMVYRRRKKVTLLAERLLGLGMSILHTLRGWTNVHLSLRLREVR